ncbi:hypothetical protein [Thermococcus chitonophagus]|uniref:hypothetical protein n=1 Tax=Thermococcus chitonophagus TaxID=54262 RepID=UPI001E2B218D|nr:hypothetical protein [Thermococcus chitonophagus]
MAGVWDEDCREVPPSYPRYSKQVVLKNGKIYLHVQVPFEVYLRYYGKTAEGRLYASFDLNSDRVNMVILDEAGIIRDVRVEHFPEVNSPGFRRGRRGI